MRALLIGDTEVARLACAVLADGGAGPGADSGSAPAPGAVVHLIQPSEAEVRRALTEDVDAVAVLIRGDVAALRYALLVEHVRPGIRLVATVFDRTLAEQLVRVVPNCQVTSPADVSLPSIVGACLGDGLLAVAEEGEGDVALTDVGGEVVQRPFVAPRRSVRAVLGGVRTPVRVHDDGTRIFLGGLGGLIGVLLVTLVLASSALHESLLHAFYLSARVVATVGPDNVNSRTAGWYLVASACSMLLTIAFTAVFTAGVVNRLLSARSIGIVGVRTVPTREHVVIVGLGQVGLRLALRLGRLGIRSVVVERDPGAVNLRLARSADIPVLIAHAEDRAVLGRLGLDRARALACMGSEELDNIEVAINALAVAPGLRIVLRAGEDDVIDETRSLFRVGQVCDVSALTALAVARSLAGHPRAIVYPRDHHVAAFDGAVEVGAVVQRRCGCSGQGLLEAPVTLPT